MVNNEFEVAQTFKKYYRNVNQKNVWQMPLNVRPFWKSGELKWNNWIQYSLLQGQAKYLGNKEINWLSSNKLFCLSKSHTWGY